MKIARVFANPAADTFSIKPFAALVKRYLKESKVSIDPFARNKQWATYTNDLNPETAAEYHLDAFDFLQLLLKQGVKADCVLFDPPYTRRQVQEVYEQIGRDYLNADSQYHSLNWKRERELINELLQVGGVVLSFGYHSNGMRLIGSYREEELLLVCHGGNHYDTICMVERKQAHQESLLDLSIPVPSNHVTKRSASRVESSPATERARGAVHCS